MPSNSAARHHSTIYKYICSAVDGGAFLDHDTSLAALLLGRRRHASKPALTRRHFSSSGGAVESPGFKIMSSASDASSVCLSARPPRLKACVVFHREKLSPSTVSRVCCVGTRPRRPPRRQAGRLQTSGAVTLPRPRKSKTSSVLLIIYMWRRWRAASRRSMIKAGPNEMQGRRGADSFFFFFYQTLALALQCGRRSQQPFKRRHQQ